MIPEQEARPRPTDAHWTWPKIAIVAITLLAMAALLLLDLEK